MVSVLVLGAVLEGKLTEKDNPKKLVKTFFFFLVFTSSLAGVFVN